MNYIIVNNKHILLNLNSLNKCAIIKCSKKYCINLHVTTSINDEDLFYLQKFRIKDNYENVLIFQNDKIEQCFSCISEKDCIYNFCYCDHQSRPIVSTLFKLYSYISKNILDEYTIEYCEGIIKWYPILVKELDLMKDYILISKISLIDVNIWLMCAQCIKK